MLAVSSEASRNFEEKPHAGECNKATVRVKAAMVESAVDIVAFVFRRLPGQQTYEERGKMLKTSCTRDSNCRVGMSDTVS